jgi:GNAT superfamily N-acetyltransferase
MIDYSWRGTFTNAELNALHAEGFDHKVLDDDWLAQVSQHSLGWVCARDDKGLAGFVNVPWDGGVHAFILDTLVTERAQHHGVGTRLVAIAADEARAAGCEWLHVDFEDHLRPFYFGSCGFTPTNAGLIALVGTGSLPGRAGLVGQQRDVQRRPRLGRPEIGAEDTLDPPQPLVEGRPGQVRVLGRLRLVASGR